MCYSGFNQEDSLIVNEHALQRGLYTSTKYQTFKDEERTSGADVEKFEVPTDECVGLRVGCYDKLSEIGAMRVGETVCAGDIMIGKTICTTEIGDGNKKTVKRDRSLIVKHGEDNAVVDALMTSRNRDGSRLYKLRTRTTRRPVVGDKLSSRHGQKGVIGMTMPSVDMPFTQDGMVPVRDAFHPMFFLSGLCRVRSLRSLAACRILL